MRLTSLLHRAPNRIITATIATATLAAGLVSAPVTGPDAATRPVAASSSPYARSVLADRPRAFLQGRTDRTGRGGAGAVIGSPSRTRLPNGERAFDFNGRGQHLRFASRPAFSIASTGRLTVEYWLRPDALQFRDMEGSGYVYVLGKGKPGQHEWYGRMYSKRNSESRPNRISGYAFNSDGGLGAGSYFQDVVRAGRWIHVALVFNTRATSRSYPTGYVKIYKNGVLRDIDSLKGYNIVPRAGRAPLRIGTGYLSSFFEGAVGNVAFYPRELPAHRLRAHRAAMFAR
jgi:hypothetical protein